MLLLHNFLLFHLNSLLFHHGLELLLACPGARRLQPEGAHRGGGRRRLLHLEGAGPGHRRASLLQLLCCVLVELLLTQGVDGLQAQLLRRRQAVREGGGGTGRRAGRGGGGPGRGGLPLGLRSTPSKPSWRIYSTG